MATKLFVCYKILFRPHEVFPETMFGRYEIRYSQNEILDASVVDRADTLCFANSFDIAEEMLMKYISVDFQRLVRQSHYYQNYLQNESNTDLKEEGEFCVLDYVFENHDDFMQFFFNTTICYSPYCIVSDSVLQTLLQEYGQKENNNNQTTLIDKQSKSSDDDWYEYNLIQANNLFPDKDRETTQFHIIKMYRREQHYIDLDFSLGSFKREEFRVRRIFSYYVSYTELNITETLELPSKYDNIFQENSSSFV